MYIVATISKNSYAPEKVREIVQAGATVLRYNLSHGSPDEVAQKIEAARGAIREAGLEGKVRIMADLPGNKLRLGKFPGSEYPAKTGDILLFRSTPESSDPAAFIPVDFPDIGSHVETGQVVTLGDGEMGLEIMEVPDADSFKARALNDRAVPAMKALNIGRAIDALDHFTPKTLEHIANLPKIKPELVAFSFPRNGADMKKGKDLLRAAGAWSGDWNPRIVSKIESPAALEHIDEIAAESDILLVARGDLGLAAPMELLGVYQKRIVAAAKRAKKEVIVSTQILDSLLVYYVPQRAEILDLTNIVLDGADGIMLAKETGISMTPGKSVETAKKIIEAVEKAGFPQ